MATVFDELKEELDELHEHVCDVYHHSRSTLEDISSEKYEDADESSRETCNAADMAWSGVKKLSLNFENNFFKAVEEVSDGFVDSFSRVLDKHGLLNVQVKWALRELLLNGNAGVEDQLEMYLGKALANRK